MSQLQYPAPPQPGFLLPPQANSAAGDHYLLVTRGCSLPKSTLMGDFNWGVTVPAGKGSAQATKGGRRWLSCCMEGRQECGAGLPPWCPSRAHQLLSPCLHPLRAVFAGWDPHRARCLQGKDHKGEGPTAQRSCLRWLSRTEWLVRTIRVG